MLLVVCRVIQVESVELGLAAGAAEVMGVGPFLDAVGVGTEEEVAGAGAGAGGDRVVDRVVGRVEAGRAVAVAVETAGSAGPVGVAAV